MNKIRVVVWGENVHEKRSEAVRKIYPEGMHQCIAKGLTIEGAFQVGTATLQEPEHGLPEARLSETDVLIWWGHLAHAEVSDQIVDRVQKRVLEGMGLIVLHSGHYSKIFKRLMGTTCSLIWREAGEKERLWICNPAMRLPKGSTPIPKYRMKRCTGMFGIPNPDEIVFVSWFQGRRSLSVGLLLETRQRQDLLFPPRPRVVSDLLSARNTNGDSKCRELGRTGGFSPGGLDTKR